MGIVLHQLKYSKWFFVRHHFWRSLLRELHAIKEKWGQIVGQCDLDVKTIGAHHFKILHFLLCFPQKNLAVELIDRWLIPKALFSDTTSPCMHGCLSRLRFRLQAWLASAFVMCI